MSLETITTKAPHGEHIELSCVHHRNKRWSTKNIAPIGARRIFYNLHNKPGMGPECNCPLKDLFAVAELESPMLPEWEGMHQPAPRVQPEDAPYLNISQG